MGVKDIDLPKRNEAIAERKALFETSLSFAQL